MRKALIIFFIIIFTTAINATSLKQVYELAVPAYGYDKYLELETGGIYTGGLIIGKIFSPITYVLEGAEGLDVKIQGNGAILDLQGEQITISYCDDRLDIEDCIIINGNIRYRGINNADYEQIPYGSCSYVTFYNAHDYGLRFQGSGQNILAERNLIVNTIDAGFDYLYLNGLSSDWLPTGSCFGVSVQYGLYGIPTLVDNWTFHETPEINEDLINHYVLLCEYG